VAGAALTALALLTCLVGTPAALAAPAEATSTTRAQATTTTSGAVAPTRPSPPPKSSPPKPTTRAPKPAAPTATRPAPKICVDEVGVLASGTCATISSVLDQDEKLTTDEIAVLVVDTTGDETIEHYATRTFNTWGIGKAGKDNGVLLLVAIDDRALRIEVGTGLDKVLTGGEADEIIFGTITPEFADGDYQAGILAGLDAIRRQLKHPVASSNSLAVVAAGDQPPATRTRTQYNADATDDYADDPETSSDNSMVLWFVLLVIVMLVSWAVSAYRRGNGDEDGDGPGGGARRSAYRSRGLGSFGGSSRSGRSSRSSGSSHRSSGGSNFGGGRSRGGGGSGSW
jgi:uncharacterized protein